MNFLEVAGFLGADAEERMTTGKSSSERKRIIELRIAAKTRKNGKEETLWWRVTIWDNRFDNMLPYFKKGTALVIFGEMNPPEIYTAKDGSVKVSLSMRPEIIRFSPFGKSEKEEKVSFSQKVSFEQEQKADYEEQSPEAGQGDEYKSNEYMAFAGRSEGFTGDDLPF